MSVVTNVQQNEALIKHIPNEQRYMGDKLPAQVTSANFDLRENETGSSCSRLEITSPIEMLNNLKCKQGAKVAAANVKDIIELGFSVVSVPEPYDPGHVEIRDGITKSLARHGDRKALRRLFKFLSLEVAEVDDSKVTWM